MEIYWNFVTLAYLSVLPVVKFVFKKGAKLRQGRCTELYTETCKSLGDLNVTCSYTNLTFYFQYISCVEFLRTLKYFLYIPSVLHVSSVDLNDATTRAVGCCSVYF